MGARPGKSLLIIGCFLIAPLVFFGLGMIGVGSDYLTNLTGSFIISKLLFGISTVVSVMSIVYGYLTMKDGTNV